MPTEKEIYFAELGKIVIAILKNPGDASLRRQIALKRQDARKFGFTPGELNKIHKICTPYDKLIGSGYKKQLRARGLFSGPSPKKPALAHRRS